MKLYTLAVEEVKEKKENLTKIYGLYLITKKILALYPNDDYLKFLSVSLKNKADGNKPYKKITLTRIATKNIPAISLNGIAISSDDVHHVIIGLKKRILAQVQEKRRKLRSIKTERKAYSLKGFAFTGYKAGGLLVCNAVNGEHRPYKTPMEAFKAISKRKNTAVAFNRKEPGSQKRHTGVELEFISTVSNDSIAGFISENGLEEYCHIKGDGSIHRTNGYTNECEITILDQSSTIRKTVEKVCKVLNNKEEVNAAVNKSCGLHVHLDLRGYTQSTLDRIWYNFCLWQDLLYAMNPGFRESTFSKRVNTFNKRFPSDWGDRYTGINPRALSKFGTIEIRMHVGTTNATKINNWIRILEAIKSTRKVPEKKEFDVTPKMLSEYLHLGSDMIEYILGRINAYAEHYKIEGPKWIKNFEPITISDSIKKESELDKNFYFPEDRSEVVIPNHGDYIINTNYRYY